MQFQIVIGFNKYRKTSNSLKLAEKVNFLKKKCRGLDQNLTPFSLRKKTRNRRFVCHFFSANSITFIAILICLKDYLYPKGR